MADAGERIGLQLPPFCRMANQISRPVYNSAVAPIWGVSVLRWEPMAPSVTMVRARAAQRASRGTSMDGAATTWIAQVR